MSTQTKVTEFDFFNATPAVHNLTTHIVNGVDSVPIWVLIGFLEKTAKPIGDIMKGNNFTLGKALGAGLRKEIRSAKVHDSGITKQFMGWALRDEWFKYVNGNGETIFLTFKSKIGYVAIRVSEPDISDQEQLVEVHKFSAGAVNFALVLKAAKTLSNLTIFLQLLANPNDDVIKGFQHITTFYTEKDFDRNCTESDLHENALAIVNEHCQKTNISLKDYKWILLVYTKQRTEILIHESGLTLQIERTKHDEWFNTLGYTCSKHFIGTAISSTPDFYEDFVALGTPYFTPSTLGVNSPFNKLTGNAMEDTELTQNTSSQVSDNADIKYQATPTDKEVVLGLLDKLRNDVMSTDDSMSDTECNETLLINLDVIGLEINAIIERHHYLKVFDDKRQQRLTGEDWGHGISLKTLSQLEYLGQRGRDSTREDHSEEDVYLRSRERHSRTRDRARDSSREERRARRNADLQRDRDGRWD